MGNKKCFTSAPRPLFRHVDCNVECIEAILTDDYVTDEINPGSQCTPRRLAYGSARLLYVLGSGQALRFSHIGIASAILI
jgi:hypothetical protein